MPDPSRRDFVRSSADMLKGGWLLLHLPALGTLAACSRDAAQRGDAFQVFTPEEGRTMAALARRILPSDPELPGAEEAGAVHFADGALARLFPEWTDPTRSFLRDLEAGSPGGFARLSVEAQDEAIRALEDHPSFELARMLVVMGTFSDPHHGGNRDGVGWRILDAEFLPQYMPPFGAYDAQARTASGEGEGSR
jgi:gluconate 2-dehydrogenase gamma chain